MSFINETPRATWLIFRMHLGTIAGSRRVLVGIVLAAIPPLLGLLAAKFVPENGTGEEIFALIGVLVLLQVIVPLLGVSLGVGVIADESESRTITYPFTRPIPRASLFLGRWFATVAVVVVLLGASGVGLALGSAMREGGASPADVKGLVGAVVLGGVVYSLGAAVIGVLAKRGLVIALGYAFAIEVLLANFPGSSQKLTLQYHLRSLFVDKDVTPWKEVEIFEMSTFLEPEAALMRIVVIGALFLVVGSWAVTRKQFVLSS